MTLSPLGKQLWGQLMWCCNQEQLEAVRLKIRGERAKLSAEDLARLRQMFAIRKGQIGEGPGIRRTS